MTRWFKGKSRFIKGLKVPNNKRVIKVKQDSSTKHNLSSEV